MAPPRNIAIVTGTRAEFGLLTTVMRAIDRHRRLRLCSIVTGTHLTTGTWRDVAAAGFKIDARVPMQRKGVIGRDADVAAMGRGVSGLGRVFSRMKPDVVLVLGDRIEALAAACAASVGGFRLAHIHGGDRAEGVADEAMRHAISKLAHLHFPATALSRERLMRMGEEADRVFNVGSPAVDLLTKVDPSPVAPELIVMQHPIGAGDRQEGQWAAATMRAVQAATKYRNTPRFIVMAPNGDPGSAGILRVLRTMDAPLIQHLPRAVFLNNLAGCRIIIGNSSAGLIEAAALRVPCVNIGPRQAGREKPNNVIDCDYGEENVARAIRRALKLDRSRLTHPYGDGRTGRRIADLLATVDLGTITVRKRNSY